MAQFMQMLGRALRETGQAMDRLGLAAMDLENTFRVPLSRHRQLMNLGEKVPVTSCKSPPAPQRHSARAHGQLSHRASVTAAAWVAPSATAIGDVSVAANSSIWYGTVLRGDQAPIYIGTDTNVQVTRAETCGLWTVERRAGGPLDDT